jgi:predicted phosphoribosyltransferase
MIMRFQDRSDAGRQLALRLRQHGGSADAIVLALPRGGVPVGFEVARALNIPLDVLLVRKLGVPGQEELAMGAIASGGIQLLNNALITALGIGAEAVSAVQQREQAELSRREHAYRRGRPLVDVTEKTVILVDDGIATGSTMQAAIASLRERNVQRIIVATPVAPTPVVEALRIVADEVVVVLTPRDFGGVGWWYEDFSQTSDDEVQRLLEASQRVETHGKTIA